MPLLLLLLLMPTLFESGEVLPILYSLPAKVLVAKED